MQLKNKTIVITGGTSGIGLEMVKQLQADNTVIVIASNHQHLSLLQQQFPEVCCMPADLSNSIDVQAVAKAIMDQFDQLDVLINNAAVQYEASFFDECFKPDNIEREININFTAVCGLSYWLLPVLRKNTPSAILNVGSGLGLCPKKASAVYYATKAAIDNFSRSLSYQCEHTNIRVLHAILPLVDTPMTRGRGGGKMSAQDTAKKILKGIESNVSHHYIGKARLLAWILRLYPPLAYRIMKKIG